MTHKYNIIDLFSGCGGLLDGFLQTGKYNDIAAIEWEKYPVETLRNRLSTKWNVSNANERVIHFDIQREDELFNGWVDDPKFLNHKGLDSLVASYNNNVDLIIGGPPCQAYSIAGRVRDLNGMNDDYRNYLFEHYLNIVNRYRPKLFILENVPGMLSAMPDGTPITDLMRRDISDIGYEIVDDIKGLAKLDASDFGVPQNRSRVILLGVNKDYFKSPKEIFNIFYKQLIPKYKLGKKISVKEAIGDLPKCMPNFDEVNHKKRISHSTPDLNISWHKPRYHNLRDIKIFNLLASDLESGVCNYTNSKSLSDLYEREVGSKSPIHRYHVLRPDLPSTTIIAHLHKDGLRYIHYDPSQCRSITVREAARLQSFDDDFEFLGSQGAAYKMIGNAVPPKLAYAIGLAVNDLLNTLQ